jgi:hypothetical protein
MTPLAFLDLVLKVLTLLGVIFAVYLYFRKPAEDSQLKDVGFEKDLASLEKMVINLRDNHIHTLQDGLNKHIQDNQTFALETTKSLTKIETLLEQHIKQ